MSSLNESDAAQVKQLRARIKEIDAQVLRAIDSRNWTTADRLDRDRVKLWKMVDKIEGVKRNHNPVRKPAAKKPAAKRAYVNRPSQATKKPPTQRLKTRRAANVRGSGMFPNPLTVDRKTITRHSLVGGIYYAVLFYANKTKPTGKPSFVIPARDRKHALGFVKALRDQGASGVALIEKTVARV